MSISLTPLLEAAESVLASTESMVLWHQSELQKSFPKDFNEWLCVRASIVNQSRQILIDAAKTAKEQKSIIPNLSGLRVICENLIWGSYLADIEADVREDVLHAMKILEIHENISVMKERFGVSGIENVGLTERAYEYSLRKEIAKQMMARCIS